MQHYNYVYFDENLVPYYVGEGSRHRWLRKNDMGRCIPVPPPERILRFEQDCKEAALVFESYLIKRIGRLDLGTGPLMNHSDGVGCLNPCESTRAAMRVRRALLATEVLAEGGRTAGRLNAGRKHPWKPKSAEHRRSISLAIKAHRAKEKANG